MTDPVAYPTIKYRGQEIPIKFRTSDVIRLKLESGLDLFRLPVNARNADAWDMVAKILSHGIRHAVNVPPMQLADELDFLNDREGFAAIDAAVTDALKKVWAQALPPKIQTEAA